MTIKTDIQQLPDTDFEELKRWVLNDETQRRATITVVEQTEAQLVEQLWEARPDLKPATGTTDITPADTEAELIAQVEQWEQPATPLDGYPRSVLTALDNKIWRNRRPGNTKRPGTPFSGWEDVTADYLTLADAVDGNAPGVGTDAPGLITEPKPEVAPADTVPPYRDGEKLSRGETRRYTDGKVYVWQKNKLEPTKPETAPDKGTGHWLQLG